VVRDSAGNPVRYIEVKLGSSRYFGTLQDIKDEYIWRDTGRWTELIKVPRSKMLNPKPAVRLPVIRPQKYALLPRDH
jgi:hypothetical protein